MSAPQGSLKQRILRAGSWTLAGYAVSQLVRVGGNLIMTRLLAPEMFGVMAIATMVLVILTMVSDLGLHQNIVQSRRGEDPAFLDTAWSLQILRGIVLWGVSLLLSLGLYLANARGLFPADSVYSAPVLPAVIAVATFAAVIMGLQSTGIPLAHRNFEQKRLVQMDLMGQLAGFAVMLGAGVATRSVWALVAGALVAAATTTTLSHVWLRRHANRPGWNREALGELIAWGKWASVSSIFSVLALNGDRILLGGYVTAEVLGMYAIAMLILGAIEGALGKLFTAVSLPALSEVARNEPARLREVYYKLRIPGDLLLLFSAGVLYMLGQWIIDLLYDPRYAAAGPMLQVLAFSFIAARYNVSYHIYLAVGRPKYLAMINVARCVSVFAAVPLAYAAWGTQGAIWAIALHGLAMVPFVHGYNVRLGLHDTRRELLVLAALPGGLAVGYALRSLLGG